MTVEVMGWCVLGCWPCKEVLLVFFGNFQTLRAAPSAIPFFMILRGGRQGIPVSIAKPLPAACSKHILQLRMVCCCGKQLFR